MTSNSRLQVKLDGDVDAWRRRLAIVRFEGPAPKKKIPKFANWLIEYEGSGILNWGLQGLEMVFEDIRSYGDIQLTDAQSGVVGALLAESDSLRHFLKDCVVKDENNDLSVSEIKEAYAEYCPKKKWNPKPVTIIEKEVEGLMLELFQTTKSNSLCRHSSRSVRGFRRVRLK
jgi:phage/plasmid-associated DNA primase